MSERVARKNEFGVRKYSAANMNSTGARQREAELLLVLLRETNSTKPLKYYAFSHQHTYTENRETGYC